MKNMKSHFRRGGGSDVSIMMVMMGKLNINIQTDVFIYGEFITNILFIGSILIIKTSFTVFVFKLSV